MMTRHWSLTRTQTVAMRRLLHPDTVGVDALPDRHDDTCPVDRPRRWRLRRACRCPHTRIPSDAPEAFQRAVTTAATAVTDPFAVSSPTAMNAADAAANYPWGPDLHPSPHAAQLHQLAQRVQQRWRDTNPDLVTVAAANACDGVHPAHGDPLPQWLAKARNRAEAGDTWGTTRLRQYEHIVSSSPTRLMTSWKTTANGWHAFPERFALAGPWQLIDERWIVLDLPSGILDLIGGRAGGFVNLGPDGPLPDRATLQLTSTLLTSAARGSVNATVAGAFETAQLLTDQPAVA